MHLNRFYCEKLEESGVELIGGEAHHLYNVCRLKVGSKVELFDGAGTLATAVIEKATGKSVLLKVINLEKTKKPDKPEVVIAVSCPKGEKFYWLTGKCTELGVDRIVPVIFERTVKQPKNPKVQQRWEKIAISSCKQCRRLFLPAINQPMSLDKTIEVLKEQYSGAKFYVGSLDRERNSIVDESVDCDVVCFIGPEGGITESEKALLGNCRAKFVRLTDTILRVETAALAFAAVLTARRDSRMKEK